jgi:hypothetical protein
LALLLCKYNLLKLNCIRDMKKTRSILLGIILYALIRKAD